MSRFGPGTDPEEAKQQVSTVVSLKDFSARSKVSAFPGSRLWNSHSIQLSSLAPSPVLTPALLITSSSTRPRSSLPSAGGHRAVKSGSFLPVTGQGSSFRRAHRGPAVRLLVPHPPWQLLAGQPFRCTLETCPNSVRISLCPPLLRRSLA